MNVREAWYSSLASLLLTLMTSCSPPLHFFKSMSHALFMLSQNQFQPRFKHRDASQEEELGQRRQASRGCQAKVKMQAQDISAWATNLVTPGAFPAPGSLIPLLWKQLDFLPLCLFWVSNKKLEGEERRHLLEHSLD